MRNVRTYANHIRLQLLQKAQVADKVLRCLVGGTDHEAGANLITYFLRGQTGSAYGFPGSCSLDAVRRNALHPQFRGAADNGWRLHRSMPGSWHGFFRRWIA